MASYDIEISVIIVNYNTKTLTLQCLESLFREAGRVSFETILVDNASQDDSVSAISERYPGVQIISLKDNIGFAGANNLAVKSAKGTYVLLLNPDTVIQNNALEEILTFARKNPNAGIWGGRTVFSDGSLNPTSCYGEMTPWSLFCRTVGLTALFPKSSFINPECFGSWQFNSVRKVCIVTGCFMLIKASLWRQLTGFDPLFFMYGEEADFCLRAKRLGIEPMFCPEAEIIHYGGASELNEGSRLTKVFRSKVTLIRIHWPKRWVWVGIVLLMIWAASRAAILSLLSAISPRRFDSRQEKWIKVWLQRNDWKKGYLRSDCFTEPFTESTQYR